MYQQECQKIQKTRVVFAAVGVIRMLKKMRDDQEAMEMLLRLKDHLEERRGDEIWTEVTDNLVPWVTSHGFGVETELIERIVGIICTNSVKWTAGTGQLQGYAVCPVFSVLNHSCLSNTMYTQTHEGEILVRANILIRKGEEILTQYRGPTQGNLLRKQQFLYYWKFSCACLRCSDPTELGTMVSAMKCEDCGDMVLPISSDVNSDWVCGGCQREQTVGGVIARLRTMEERLMSLSPTESPEAWEFLLSQFQKEVHEDHYLCMTIKRVLLSMYGAWEGYKLNQLPRNLIDRKIELCKNYVTIFSRLDPGFRDWLGEVLDELINPLTISINQDIKSSKISKMEYMMKIKEVIGCIKDATKCKQFSGSNIEENGLHEAIAESFRRHFSKDLMNLRIPGW